MTRMQEMSLDYHFTVEQEVGSSTHAFFGFNGNIAYSKLIQYELVEVYLFNAYYINSAFKKVIIIGKKKKNIRHWLT